MAETKETARVNASIAPDQFDWAAFEEGDVYGGEDKKAIDQAYASTLNKVVENEAVEGEVTEINKRERDLLRPARSLRMRHSQR